MKINNWALVSIDQKEGLVLPSDYEPGKCYITGFDEEDNNKFILMVAKGDLEKYPLCQKHTDYVKYINAYKNNIPIMKNWQISEDGRLYGTHFKKIKIIKGIEVTYVIAGRVVKHNLKSNIVTFLNGEKAFVDWYSVHPKLLEILKDECDEHNAPMLDFAGQEAKLDIKGVHKFFFD